MSSFCGLCPAGIPVNPVERFRSLLEKLQVQLGVRKASSSRKQIFECILLLYAHEVRRPRQRHSASPSFARKLTCFADAALPGAVAGGGGPPLTHTHTHTATLPCPPPPPCP